MPTYPFQTVDVFTDRRFGGNPLAVFTDARGMSDADMQALAAEFNLSETTFVLPPEDPAHTARVRIFTPTAEMPFAGHPNVGTGYVLGGLGRARDGVLLFEELAGLVEVRLEGEGAVVAAPQPLSLGLELPEEVVAACAGIDPGEVVLDNHAPVLASMGFGLIMAEVTPEALTRAAPKVDAFHQAVADWPSLKGGLSLHLYALGAAQIRTRMFAPLHNIPEDPATGSANVALAGLLLSLTDEPSAVYDIVQGVEMGRPSRLACTAHRTEGGIRATVGGGCVPVLKGEATI
ncbi:MAG: PhzF family phenazine biosynthesis protein [Caulobacteraceae bacterium]